ncbi:hypothetical protein Salat_0606500 [Sesamum alatum]|uniref:Uncharacterized protein n=1 Tax=Sesamum alatum TaxID=300844 RepID=A0AAE1YQU0_9LAMI|nr:hypothetical protein Salat_0606500 [Sesamum alatum]
MEKTFVDALVGHAKADFFRLERKNIYAVMCALYDVNKKHGTKITCDLAFRSQLFDPANYANNDVIDADSKAGNVYDSSNSSSSMWRWMEEFYDIDSDGDSVLPPPGVPRAIGNKTLAIAGSLPSSKSSGATSSTTSNATPIKKEE